MILNTILQKIFGAPKNKEDKPKNSWSDAKAMIIWYVTYYFQSIFTNKNIKTKKEYSLNQFSLFLLSQITRSKFKSIEIHCYHLLTTEIFGPSTLVPTVWNSPPIIPAKVFCLLLFKESLVSFFALIEFEIMLGCLFVDDDSMIGLLFCTELDVWMDCFCF